VSKELLVGSLNNPSQKFRTLIGGGGVVENQMERIAEKPDLKALTDLEVESVGIIADQVQDFELLQRIKEDLEENLEEVSDLIQIYSGKQKRKVPVIGLSFIDDIEETWSENYGYIELKHKFPSLEEMLFGNKRNLLKLF